MDQHRQGNHAEGAPITRTGAEGDEHALLVKAVKGDGPAFSALLETYYGMIYGAAFKWTGKREDAEDIAQDVCIKVGRAIRRFRMDAKFSTWLYRIVLNTAKDYRRKTRDHANIDDTAEAHLADKDQNSPEEQVGQNQLWKLVRRLAPKQRDAVLLVYAEDLSHAQAAEVLGCAETTVSWYIHEGRKELKLLMDRHDA